VADFLVLPADVSAVLGMAAWRNRKITKVIRQLLVPQKMAELHELQPVLRMRVMLKARPHPSIAYYNANINPRLPNKQHIKRRLTTLLHCL
jgi:hypothetical protein